MAFCTRCGANLQPGARFCISCGTAVPGAPQQMAPRPTMPGVAFYPGRQVTLPFLNRMVTVSPEMDAFAHYRRLFHRLAQNQAEALRQEYYAHIHDLDSYLINFPVMYTFYRQPLIEAACEILMQAGIYDISAQQFSDSHKEDFCLCGEDMDTMIESFNLTIEANQERKIRAYNMMPGIIFSGIGGLALALATNVAINAIAEADIRNANVTPKQRQELFARIDPNMLMYRAFLDYWRVFLTLTWLMRQRGVPMWYPTDDTNQRSVGIYQNLNSGRIPPDRVLDMTIALLQIQPFNDDYLAVAQRQFGRNPQTEAVFAYFSVT